MWTNRCPARLAVLAAHGADVPDRVLGVACEQPARELDDVALLDADGARAPGPEDAIELLAGVRLDGDRGRRQIDDAPLRLADRGEPGEAQANIAAEAAQHTSRRRIRGRIGSMRPGFDPQSGLRASRSLCLVPGIEAAAWSTPEGLTANVERLSISRGITYDREGWEHEGTSTCRRRDARGRAVRGLERRFGGRIDIGVVFGDRRHDV